MTTTVVMRTARELTDLIKVKLGEVWALIVEAYQSGAWLELDYDSWDDYCRSEFDTDRLRIPAGEERDRVIAMMAGAGMSQRQIGSATGLGLGTVSRSTSVPNGTDDDLEPPVDDDDDDVLTEKEWEDDRPNEERRRLASDVEKAFSPLLRARQRLDVVDITELARADENFAATLRSDIAVVRTYLKELETALRSSR